MVKSQVLSMMHSGATTDCLVTPRKASFLTAKDQSASTKANTVNRSSNKPYRPSTAEKKTKDLLYSMHGV